MSLVQFIILGLFDQIAYILISRKLLSSPKIETKKLLIFLVTMLSISVMNYYWFGSYQFLISTITFFLLTKYVYGKSLYQSFYSTIITTSIMTIIQAGILVIITLAFDHMEKTFFYGLLAQIIFLIIVIIIARFTLNSIFEFINKENRIFIGLIMNGFVLVFIVVLYWTNDVEGFFESILLIGITVMILASLNFLYLVKGLENEHERSRLKMYDRYHRITEDLIDDIKGRQHEFDNHIQAIKMTHDNFVDVEYIKNLDSRNDLGNLIKLQSNILGGLLYAKKKEAIRSGIDFKINIENFDYLERLQEYELIDIVGNLLDNAFEAIGNYKQKIVTIDFKKEHCQNVIEVSNRYEYLSSDVIADIFKKGVSTKMGNNRGFGLYNIRKIINKYNGTIEVQNSKYSNQNYIIFKIKV